MLTSLNLAYLMQDHSLKNPISLHWLWFSSQPESWLFRSKIIYRWQQHTQMSRFVQFLILMFFLIIIPLPTNLNGGWGGGGEEVYYDSYKVTIVIKSCSNLLHIDTYHTKYNTLLSKMTGVNLTLTWFKINKVYIIRNNTLIYQFYFKLQ